jgi:hypothetical protein
MVRSLFLLLGWGGCWVIKFGSGLLDAWFVRARLRSSGTVRVIHEEGEGLVAMWNQWIHEASRT